jgi:hypothetical protein
MISTSKTCHEAAIFFDYPGFTKFYSLNESLLSAPAFCHSVLFELILHHLYYRQRSGVELTLCVGSENKPWVIKRSRPMARLTLSRPAHVKATD